MAQDDGLLAHSFCAGGPHVVAAEHFQQSGADEAHQDGGVAGADGQAGQDQPLEPLADAVLRDLGVADGGEPAELDGEDEDEDDADPEARHADADEGDHTGGVVETLFRRSAAMIPAGTAMMSAITNESGPD